MHMDDAPKRLRKAFSAVEPGTRHEILAALDEITRPLSPREIEAQLRARGVSNSQRRVLAGTLSGLKILIIEEATKELPGG